MSSATVRQATASDIGALVDLRAEMFAAMGASGTDGPWRDRAHEWFSARVADADYRFVVVDVDGQVVSCAVGALRSAAPSPAVPDGRDVVVSNICTAAEHRGRGYGRAAFEAVMTWARRTGASRAELMATPSGRDMYQAAGFRDAQFPAMRAAL